MKIPAVLLTCGLATVVYALEGDFNAGLPDGWKLSGEAPRLYSAGIDSADSPSGAGSVVLRRTETSHAYGSATLTKNISAANYAGKRIRVSIRIRFDGVAKGEGRVFVGHSGGNQMTGDSRTIGWHWHRTTLDVPAQVRSLDVGAWLRGEGSVKMDGVDVQVLDNAPPQNESAARTGAPA